MFISDHFTQHKPITILLPDHPDYLMRQAVVTDASDLHQQCWPDYPSGLMEELLSRINNLHVQGRGTGLVIVHRHSNCIAGYGQIVKWGDKAEISDLIIAEAHRSQGLGTQLIRHLLQHAANLPINRAEIGVAASNRGAYRLYQRLGFEDTYTMLMDLGHGLEKVIYMQRPLTIPAFA